MKKLAMAVGACLLMVGCDSGPHPATERDEFNAYFYGSVANPDVDQETAGDDLRLGGHAEESSNEITLSLHIVCWCVQNLTFADHRHRLVAGNRL